MDSSVDELQCATAGLLAVAGGAASCCGIDGGAESGGDLHFQPAGWCTGSGSCRTRLSEIPRAVSACDGVAGVPRSANVADPENDLGSRVVLPAARRSADHDRLRGALAGFKLWFDSGSVYR